MTGGAEPLNRRSNVVFPEPFGPRMPASVPSVRLRVTPLTTSGLIGCVAERDVIGGKGQSRSPPRRLTLAR